LVAAIIRQGVAEGCFTAASPEHTAQAFMALFMGINETATDLFVGYLAGAVTVEQAEGTLAAFGDAFERVLGARPGALRPADRLAVVREWFDASTPAVQRSSA